MRATTIHVLVCSILAACGGDTPQKENDGGVDAGRSDAGAGTDSSGLDDGSSGGDDDVRPGRDTADGRADTGADVSMDAAGRDATSHTDAGPVGGERPARVVVPSDWRADTLYPVVVLLHGYSANSNVQNLYFRIETLVDELQFVLVLPEGTEDAAGNQFWNATNACCDFNGSAPDDSAYLAELLDEVLDRHSGDPSRAYFFGHSNGGFMSYRMACDHAEKIAAIASLAGSTWLEPEDCSPSEPVGVAQMHGTLDATVPYVGAANLYPGAEDAVAQWRAFGSCSDAELDAGRHDFDNAVLGDETEITRWEGCESDVAIELWRMENSGHIPTLDATFTRRVLEFLFAHQKP